jgi:Bacterial Ig-like domain (group 3)
VGTFAGSTTSSPLAQVVNAPTKTVTATSLVSSANPSIVGQLVTFTASVSPTPDGATVAFTDSKGQITACSAQAVSTTTGQATCTFAFTTAETDNITATYSGDTNFAGSTTSTPLAQVINAATTATTTSLASSANPSIVDQLVTFTASVSPVPSGGTVAFTDSKGQITGCGTQAVSTTTGQATCSFAFTTAETDNITATYSGSGSFTGSTTSSPLAQVVNPLTATTTALSSSANPSVVDQLVTFTATVSPIPSGGTVAFTDSKGQITACSAQSVSSTTGQATCSFTFTTAETDNITATFSGVGTFAGSTTSTPLAQVINVPTLTATTTTLTSSANPATAGTAVTFTATVSPTPDPGTVAFSDTLGQITACTAQAVSSTTGTATCTFTFTTAETDNISATYSGDSSFAGSTTSTPLAQVVNPATTTAQKTSISTEFLGVGEGRSRGDVIVVTNGSAVTDTASLAGKNAAQATGTVTYTVFALVHTKHWPFWQWVPVASGGTVTITGGVIPDSNAVTLTPGAYEWQATYSGDSLNDQSMSRLGSETEIVIPAPQCHPAGRWDFDQDCRANAS